jgi:hypothetical protein
MLIFFFESRFSRRALFSFFLSCVFFSSLCFPLSAPLLPNQSPTHTTQQTKQTKTNQNKQNKKQTMHNKTKHKTNKTKSHGLDQEEVVYERLPADIAERHVLLLDPVLGTGHTACRAVQVVLARGVPQSRVLFLCMIATPEGVARVARAFPGVRIVTSEVDARLDERWRVVPGIGQFGDRYFGL